MNTKLILLAIVRHGDYYGTAGEAAERLNPVGKIKMRTLASKIWESIPDARTPVLILHSPAKRTKESAQVLFDKLIPTFCSISIQQHPALYSDEETKPNLEEITTLINSEEGAIIVVTHAEVMEQLPHHIDEHLLNGGLPLPPRSDMYIGQGGAFLINCQTKTFTPVFP